MQTVCQSPAATLAIGIPNKEETQVGLSSSSVLPCPHYIKHHQTQLKYLEYDRAQDMKLFEITMNKEAKLSTMKNRFRYSFFQSEPHLEHLVPNIFHHLYLTYTVIVQSD